MGPNGIMNFVLASLPLEGRRSTIIKEEVSVVGREGGLYKAMIPQFVRTSQKRDLVKMWVHLCFKLHIYVFLL